ncbi:Cobalt/zinc/cadmium efflux RND transporter, membrane fusion protein, CzcB family [Fimbriiglobus ruber]|uniref:Cobalt/zinc/cadmium efflux RND transporter, membrane fusion protein, CzcB family n=1 Tax=Fimbriiglobus ruber TaxID=1908690 RepID=A0A225E437_9BACT|nr:Cobalt/zinc/cadmium efflux RND transporter, membrane fusion protein, CzcB family [Fimbriiglobus ruber]
MIAVAFVGGAGFAGYKTQDRWMPYVFPGKPPVKVDGDHEEGDGPAHGNADHAGRDHDHGHGDRVKLSTQAQANLNLDVDAIAPEAYWRSVLIPGMVVDRPGESDRGVTSRIAGLVTDIKARPGDTVKAGDPLFSIQLISEFIQSAQTELAKAAKEHEFAATKRDRTSLLVKGGTSAGADLVEAENQVKRTAGQVQIFRRQLQVFGLTAEQTDKVERGEVVTDVTVTAPARPKRPGESALVGKAVDPLFEVQELKVQLGEQVQAGQTLCLLANHQQLFVEGRAFKSEATVLARAAESKVPVRADFADEAVGDWPAQEALTIHHLANQVDPATRTFAFYLPLENQSRTFEKDGKTFFVWRYRPGQRVRLRVPVEKLGDEVFVLPAGAVVREGAETFVFRQNGDYFERKAVRVLYEDRSEVVIANDGSVAAGSFVVRNQAAAINRALKAAAGGGGGHEGHDHAGHSHEH